MHIWGAAGLALATSLSGITQTIALLYFLRRRYHFNLYGAYLWRFLLWYSIQLLLLTPLFMALHFLTKKTLAQLLPLMLANERVVSFFMQGVGFWIWTGPIVLLFIATLFFTRHIAGYRLFYVE